LAAWSEERGVPLEFIQPGKPVQNAYVESFNDRLRDECLNANWFISLSDARRKIETWQQDYKSTTPAQLSELLAARRICTDTSGDAGMSYRFGSLHEVYKLIGYGRPESFRKFEARRRNQALRDELLSEIVSLIPERHCNRAARSEMASAIAGAKGTFHLRRGCAARSHGRGRSLLAR
jgi:putative transposase